jgi:hypothetical protein
MTRQLSRPTAPPLYLPHESTFFSFSHNRVASPKMNDKDIAKSNARWESFNAFLASASKLTGFPALIIACVALIVSTIGLDYIVANYNLQKESIRPALVALSAFINSAGPNNSEVVFQWNNVGRGTLSKERSICLPRRITRRGKSSEERPSTAWLLIFLAAWVRGLPSLSNLRRFGIALFLSVLSMATTL